MLKSEAPDEGAVIQNAPVVLIADDDPAIRLILRHRLEAAGYNVSEASDSAGALAALKTNRFDVALLDIIMPGSGGLEVLSAAQTDGVRTAIIVITAA
ncbi:MAG TPA: response regulator, partial [Candidatus Binataceae bacterium]|nr:response regulator [Candidatus Binataceae bacterium]